MKNNVFFQFTAGKCIIITDNVIDLDCPNGFGGIGQLTVKPSEMYADYVSIYSDDPISICFGDVEKIETRSNLDETDEPWKTIWKMPKKEFCYSTWINAAKIVDDILKHKSL